MKVIGHIFDPPIHRPLTPMDPEFHLETSPVLWWIGALYYDRIVSAAHGIWDNTVSSPSISDHNRIEANDTYYIQCNATEIEFTVKVHPVERTFEVHEFNSYAWRVVFRLIGHGNKFSDGKELRIDRIDGDPRAVLNYFMHLKLTGEDPSFEVIG